MCNSSILSCWCLKSRNFQRSQICMHFVLILTHLCTKLSSNVQCGINEYVPRGVKSTNLDMPYGSKKLNCRRCLAWWTKSVSIKDWRIQGGPISGQRPTHPSPKPKPNLDSNPNLREEYEGSSPETSGHWYGLTWWTFDGTLSTDSVVKYFNIRHV